MNRRWDDHISAGNFVWDVPLDLIMKLTRIKGKARKIKPEDAKFVKERLENVLRVLYKQQTLWMIYEYALYLGFFI